MPDTARNLLEITLCFAVAVFIIAIIICLLPLMRRVFESGVGISHVELQDVGITAKDVNDA